MGKGHLLIAAMLLVACAKNETAKTDSAGGPGGGTPPSAITAADLVGTLNGQVMAQGSDSVLSHFTCVQSPNGNESRCVDPAAPKDTTVYGFAMSGDSVMWTSAAYKSATLPKNPQVIDHVVGRMYGRKWAGTIVTVLASKPDSAVLRARWEGTKAR